MTGTRRPNRRTQLRNLGHRLGISLPILDTIEIVDDGPVLPPRKHEAPCCVAKMDAIGRLPIGFCGPECVRRIR